MEATMSSKGFKRKKCVVIDRISELPDEIIAHILSFLPLENAVATSILSRGWLDLWTYTSNLIFLQKNLDEPIRNRPIGLTMEERSDLFLARCLKNTELVNSVLNSHKALFIRQFTISLEIDEKTYHQVSKWLHFVFSRQVESLKLNFQFSFYVLDIKTLSGLQIGDYRFLKELTLENFHVSGEAIEFLLRKCSLLEGLTLKGILTSDLVIHGMLKYLDIVPWGIWGKYGTSIKVFAPNLTRLSCNHDYELLFLENVPNLVEASFWFVLSQCTVPHFPMNNAAKLESLTITLCNPKVFSIPQMPKLKKSVLDYSLVNTEYLLPVTCLLQASPYLEEFKFEITDLNMYFYASPFYKTILEVPKNERFHYHLKVFEFAGFCVEARDHIELVMYIVNNCVALEKIIITPICTAVARQFIQRLEILHPLLDEVVEIAEDRHALAIKISSEQLLAGKIPDHIKLIIK